MNLCAKINSLGPANAMVIGNNLYQFVKRLSYSNSSLFSNYGNYYQFEQVSKYVWEREQEGLRSNASSRAIII